MSAFLGHSDDNFDQWRRRMSAPENEIPVPIPVNPVLGRTEDACIAVVGVQAYSTGVAFRLAVRMRTRAPSVEGLSRVLTGYHDPGDDPEARLLLGVEFSDGRRATNMGGGPPPEELPDLTAPVLSPCGGGGGDRAHDLDYFLSPLPSEGDLLLVCACAPLKIPESRVVIDGGAIARAGAAAIELWPPAPFDDEPVPPPPRRPADGWFSGQD
jgi:hypothetical protein